MSDDVIERAERALEELSHYDAGPLWEIVRELIAEIKRLRKPVLTIPPQQQQTWMLVSSDENPHKQRWVLVSSDAEPPMHFCPDCGGDLDPPDPNAIQICPICDTEQPQ